MRKINNVTICLVLAIIIAVYSVSTSFGVYTSMEQANKISYKISKEKNVQIKNLSTFAFSDEGITLLKEPNIIGDVIHFSLKMDYLNSYGQFKFSVDNSGDVDVIVKDIKIEGLNNESEYVNVAVNNLNIGDVIESGTLLNNINIVTTYKKQYFDETFTPQSILLNDVSVQIEFDTVE